MRRLRMLVLASFWLVACGSAEGEAGGAEEPAATGAGTTGSDDSEEGEVALAAEDEEEAEPDDGSRCLPVATCNSFANQVCALVTADGVIEVEGAEPLEGARVLEACPGGRGVDQSVESCFSYVDRESACRRAPDVRRAEWPCGPVENARCGLQTF